MIHPTLAKLVIPVDEIHPTPRNPRKGEVERIAESLDRNGQYRPIVVNRRTGEILAGNHTYRAARHLGWTEIAATFVDVDEDAAARIILADNRTADLGTYDDSVLAAMLQDLDDLAGTGYTTDDLDALLHTEKPLPEGDADTDDFAGVWGVIIECSGEDEQLALLERFMAEGLNVRAML